MNTKIKNERTVLFQNLLLLYLRLKLTCGINYIILDEKGRECILRAARLTRIPLKPSDPECNELKNNLRVMKIKVGYLTALIKKLKEQLK